MTAVSLGSSSACISKVSINAAGVSIIGKFRCPGVSYDIGRSPFSLSKILLKKIVLSFSPFGNPFLELVGVGEDGFAPRDRFDRSHQFVLIGIFEQVATRPCSHGGEDRIIIF